MIIQEFFRPFSLLPKQRKNALIKFIHCNLHFKYIPYCLLANHDSEFRYVIYSGITLFAPCHTLTLLLLANQNRLIFSYILLCKRYYCYSSLILLTYVLLQLNHVYQHDSIGRRKITIKLCLMQLVQDGVSICGLLVFC